VRTLSGIHVIAKPIGAVCNINCAYCFYLEKRGLFPKNEDFRMSDDVLSAFIRQYIEAQPFPEVEFVWQGGEPTLLGIDFFRRMIKLQKEHKRDKKVRNCLQTNGVLLNDEWCEFLKKHDFLVGISLDGPKEVHDIYRKDSTGKGTFDKAVRGLRLLKKHGVEFNVLASVAKETAKAPLDIYHFLKDEGVKFIQFTPVVEREAGSDKISSFTVGPEMWGDFLIRIFDEWVRNDVGKTFVMNFEWALNAWVKNASPVCIFSENCGRSLVIEHNGDVYSCDHFVHPKYLLGNVLKSPLKDLVEIPAQKVFGEAKSKTLPDPCKKCAFLFACRGECPKRRFVKGLNYLCPGYKRYFQHIDRYMRTMAQLLSYDRPVSDIMKASNGPPIINLDKKG